MSFGINYPPDHGNLLASVGVACWNKTADDGAAATTTAETVIGQQGPNVGFTVGSVTFSPHAALTSNDTSYATITVSKRTAGGAATTIAVATTKTTGGGGTGDWAAWTPVTIPVSAGALVSAKDVLTVTIGKSGSGVVVPQGALEVFAAAA